MYRGGPSKFNTVKIVGLKRYDDVHSKIENEEMSI